MSAEAQIPGRQPGSPALRELRELVAHHRFTLIALSLVILGSSAGGVAAANGPEALLLLGAICAGAGTLAAAYWLPGLIFAAYLSTPFFKAGLQPFLPIDITVILALLCTLQIPLLALPHERPALRFVTSTHVRQALLLWLSLCLLIIVGITYAPDTNLAISSAANWVLLTFLPILGILRLLTKRRFLTQFLWGLVMMGAAVTVVGVWTLPQVGAWPNDRLRVFGAHTIRVGQAALLLPIVAVPFVFRSSPPITRLVCLGFIPPAMVVAASSGSRGPLLMLAICSVLFSMRRLILWATGANASPSRIAPLRLLVPAIFLSLVIFLMPLSSIGRFIPQTSAARLESLSTILTGIANQDLSDEAPDNSTGDRLIAYQFAENIFKGSPVVGKGTSSFVTLVSTEEPRLIFPEPIEHPHNLVLEMASEYGMIGLLILALLSAVAIRRGFRNAQDPIWNTLTILFVFFLLGSMVSTEMFDNRMLWGLTMMLLLSPDPARAGAILPRPERAQREIPA